MRYFYLALNFSHQDDYSHYLVWVETDNEGRILDRVRGKNWGKADKKDYEKRLQNNDAVLRENDKTKIRLVRKPNKFDVRLRFEKSSGLTYEQEFTPYMPPYLKSYLSR